MHLGVFVMNLKLKYALILALVFNSAFAISDFFERTYDSYTHMFFADHYRKSWFDSWNPKWYGGFSMFSYTPLGAQTIALLSYVTGLVAAYQILTLLLMLLFPLAVYMVSTTIVPDDAAGYASILAAFLPSVVVAAYVWGQFPTIFSLVLTLFTAFYVNNYLKSGNKLELALALCLLGASVSIHHFTAIFFLPPLLIVIVATSFLQRKVDIKTGAKRLLQFIIIGIMLSAIVLYPFLLYTINNPMKPIPHATRTNYLSDSYTFEIFVLRAYGSALLLIPLICIFVRHQKKLIPLFSLAILLFALGLGGTTILPQIIFGKVWELLTYDRFALWAGVAFLPLFGLFLAHHYSTLRKGKKREIILGIFLVTLVFSAAYSGSKSIMQPTEIDLEPMLEFLGKDGNWKWRYLTLGFGDSKMQELSLFTNATTLDGYFAFARRTPILANSSIGSIDTAKFFGEEGLNVLKAIFENAQEYNLKWVFCNDPFYYDVLIQSGFTLLYSQDIVGDSRFHGVTVWAKDGIPQIDVNQSDDLGAQQVTLSEYAWGIMPPSLLMASLALFALRFAFKRKKTSQLP